MSKQYWIYCETFEVATGLIFIELDCNTTLNTTLLDSFVALDKGWRRSKVGFIVLFIFGFSKLIGLL